MSKIIHRSKRHRVFLGVAIGLFAQIHSGAAYEPNFTRYISGHDVLRLLEQAYPNATLTSANNQCIQLGDAAQILGVSQPASGTPISNTPGPAFLNWYKSCLKEHAKSDVENTLRNGIVSPWYSDARYTTYANTNPAQTNGPTVESMRMRYIPLSLKSAARVPSPFSYSGFVDRVKSSPWKQLPVAFRVGLLKHWITAWVGPEIIRNQAEFIRTLDERLLQTNPNLMDAARRATVTLMLREEALTY